MTARQQAILIGAVVTGVLSTSYFFLINVLCCLGVILGGGVAAQQYASRTGALVESGDGAVLGALAGVGGVVLQQLFNWALRPLGLDVREIVLQFAKQMQGQEGMSQQMMEQAQASPGLGTILFNLAVGMIVYAIFGAIGGAVGAAIFGGDGQEQEIRSGSSQPGSPQSGGSEARGSASGGARSGPSGGPQDESAGGSESNREGSV